METALQSVIVKAPKVQDYIGDLLNDPFRIIVVINYLVGIINRFADGGVEAQPSYAVDKALKTIPQYKQMR